VNPSTALATVVVDELVRHGVRDAVLCPGSRSAAFAYALQDADRAGRLRLHVRVDERSAGFLALGLAKLARRPVAVFTTSGTAVANLHPAVLEASHASVPLIVVSADRPAELQGTGANQTTDQSQLFGTAIRLFHRLGVPERSEGQNKVWRSAVSRLCAAARGATGSDPGPVQLNVPLREPLVPDLEQSGGWPESLAGRDDSGPWVIAQQTQRQAPALASTPRTLLVLGDLPDPAMALQVMALARASGWPLIAEPFGAHDFAYGVAYDVAYDSAHDGSAHDRNAGDGGSAVPHGPLLLTAVDWLGQHLPARIVVVGRITLSRPVGDLLRNPAVRVEVVAAQSSWPDASHVASLVHPFETVASSIQNGRQVDEDWARGWADCGRLVSEVARPIITDSWPSGLAIADVLLAEMVPDATLFVGSSNSARDVDLAMSPSVRSDPMTVVASRGLAGIDGCVSTSVGLALSGSRGSTYALMGDLTFLHDSNGLLIGPSEPRPDLTIVVTNDDGGGIFTLLEQGEPDRAQDFERVFGTPTGASIVDICRAHGVRHTLAATDSDLRAALRQPPDGLAVVEVRVDRSAHRHLHAELRAAAARAVF
jgi:2-succinyl-5-enolpyruvyl-6-hydroxy-3-cyclohexene-1-carboxylate synthase